jgi:hypothetical protein
MMTCLMDTDNLAETSRIAFYANTHCKLNQTALNTDLNAFQDLII